MKRFATIVLAASLLCSVGTALAQEEHKHDHSSAAKGPKLEKAYLQQVLDAWCTLEPKNAAKFYGKGTDHVFYDVSPLQYRGWAEYEKGAGEFLKTLKSAKMVLKDDTQIHQEGGIAWSTSTMDFTMVGQDGKTVAMPLRWTAIWHNHGANWVIAHEHVSAPLPEEPPKQ
ncbi:MAG TPA: nuclear transport factor 2 family protein [Candidatus Nanoarchaeia archaeon]|nr:nuclear transport factor 2 family protein [Candidatus Nanoarchaeia archaeon]